jgi:GMP synthase (glutamine-hydrolysing)
MEKIQILIVDLSSQYTTVIGRTLQELGYRSIIFSPIGAEKWLKSNKPKTVILSGGSASVFNEDAPSPPENILKLNVPILGICYGMQWLAKNLGGKVIKCRENKEYGETHVKFDTDLLFEKLAKNSVVWASHGDSVDIIPKGFRVIARSGKSKTIAAMSDPKRKIWGVQFHPEVTHTEYGKRILKRFISQIAKCREDWKPENEIENIRQEVWEATQGKKCIIGFSGGVDSTGLSAIIAPILGKNLLAVCIDTGALRKDEIGEIKLNAKKAGVDLKIIRASGRFQKALGNKNKPEVKRKFFQPVYVAIFNEVAKRFGAEFVLQGTLRTDMIESGKVGDSALIKSHHNVGLKNLKITELHPFRRFFKHEVRELARKVGLPKSISERQPFPGPGLFIRVIGLAPKPKKIAIVRWADATVREILEEHKIYDDISQLVVALDCQRTVGIKGDGRSYGYSIIVRAVKTVDFMTTVGYQIPKEVRREITNAVTKHEKIVRVFFDETNKPPATTEME